jgi:predicted flap endonuclease-1-like 5' DNA nuclease
VEANQISEKLDVEEENTMIGVILATFFALALVGAGLALLVWWLWHLWKRHEEEAVAASRTADAIEIKAEAPPQEVVAPAVEAEAEEPSEVPEAESEVEEPAEEVEAEASTEEVAEEVEPPAPDDLKRIEGIGPKIASVLQKGGISTYVQLAGADPDDLRQILEKSDPRLLRIADPSTWPEQAAFAADGDWDGLTAMQNTLKAGRRA